MRFLGIEVGERLPDENTIRDFKEALKNAGLDHKLFELVNENLEDYGIKVKTGTMADIRFVEAKAPSDDSD